ncbi:MAG: citrate lyase subunit alpha, partial [Candidatus Phytoplasma australasiaticum]|nr:citrate lyase subunit alpha [Candidatus Phytoplasma australasiaticum]
QTGTGGASQASLVILSDEMRRKQIKASVFLGGITHRLRILIKKTSILL